MHTPLQGTISIAEEAERLKAPEILKDLDKVKLSEHYSIFIFALMNSKLCWLPTKYLNKIKLVNIPIYKKEGHMSLHPHLSSGKEEFRLVVPHMLIIFH